MPMKKLTCLVLSLSLLFTVDVLCIYSLSMNRMCLVCLKRSLVLGGLVNKDKEDHVKDRIYRCIKQLLHI
jgi:hypothetical protein